jgi:hypothetical protein
MATLQDRGRISLARAIAQLPIHLAWGSGLPAWDAAPEPEPSNATALVNEIGRRTATQIGYAVPDEAGSIELVSGRYSIAPEPTQWVYVRFTFDFADAAGETIRELGIFTSTVLAAGLPAGQRYFTPAQVSSLGDLYALERIPHFVRNGAVRQFFEYVLPF